MGSLNGLAAVSAPSCSTGWLDVQKALNTRLMANGYKLISADGKRCCGRSSTGVVYGETWNALAWWVGPWKTTASKSSQLTNIQAQTRAFMVEPPSASAVFAIQGALKLQQDGCLGPGTATKISEVVGAEWVNMPLKEVLARINNPSAFTSSTPTGTATTATLAPSTVTVPSVTKPSTITFRPRTPKKTPAETPPAETPPANGAAPSDEAPPGEAEQAAPARAAAFNFGKFALYSGVGIAALLVLAKFAKKKA